MCTRKEFESRLDIIPAEYPYKYVADLREAHRLFHLGIDMGKSGSLVIGDLEQLAIETMNFEPSDLAKALNLVNNISDAPIFTDGTSKILEIVQELYTKHNPPEKIDHSY